MIIDERYEMADGDGAVEVIRDVEGGYLRFVLGDGSTRILYSVDDVELLQALAKASGYVLVRKVTR